ncbi:hypothetical protein BDV29DRAFT_163192 [Aspergillus leporis]|uniref:USP domain-containing protein n=1 Tax=Aspergillus leporis TaxID=41062 RepID=A0A5N5WGW1_9EURO|nr:hypothetical protein BDV29DRAFT_163192 [Aspergillus leporis]
MVKTGNTFFAVPFADGDGQGKIEEAINSCFQSFEMKRECTNCECQTTQKVHETLANLPELLFVQVQRYSTADIDAKSFRKLAIQEDLTIRDALLDFTSPAHASPRYELYATIFHDGEDRKQGHYTVTVKRPTGQWILIDDDRDPKIVGRTVSQMMKSRKNHTRNAYKLAYRRLSLDGDVLYRKEFPETGYEIMSDQPNVCDSLIAPNLASKVSSSGCLSLGDEHFVLPSPRLVSSRSTSPQPVAPSHPSPSVPEPSESHIETGVKLIGTVDFEGRDIE